MLPGMPLGLRGVAAVLVLVKTIVRDEPQRIVQYNNYH